MRIPFAFVCGSFFVARAVAAWHLAASRAVAARGARARRRSAVGEALELRGKF